MIKGGGGGEGIGLGWQIKNDLYGLPISHPGGKLCPY